jgi:hypothetical protein
MQPAIPRRRRGLLAAALAISMLLALQTAPASAGTGVKDWVCDYRWRASTFQIKKTIRCAARRWHVPGGPRKALSVASCESRFDPAAYGSGNAGVFQQALRYWPGRARAYGLPRASAYNGRANVIVSIRMAHAVGWGPWSCA